MKTPATKMTIVSFAMLLMMAAAGPADAKGCLKGAFVGGVAGHYAGHHGLVGAAAGCLIGRHEAAEREKARRQGATGDDTTNPDHH